MDKRKELKKSYQSRTIVGGVFRISCEESSHAWIKATKNLQEQKNRFGFAMQTGGCPEPGMWADWKQYGSKAFSFTVMEELEKKESQSEDEFARDIEALLELWNAGRENEGEN